MVFTDLWELPDSRHTATLTDALEQSFFARCPSEKRPRYMRDAVDPSDESEKEEKPTPGVVADPTPQDDAPVYDESVFKAVHQTFFRRIWWSGLLLLASGLYLAKS